MLYISIRLADSYLVFNRTEDKKHLHLKPKLNRFRSTLSIFTRITSTQCNMIALTSVF